MSSKFPKPEIREKVVPFAWIAQRLAEIQQNTDASLARMGELPMTPREQLLMGNVVGMIVSLELRLQGFTIEEPSQEVHDAVAKAEADHKAAKESTKQ